MDHVSYFRVKTLPNSLDQGSETRSLQGHFVWSVMLSGNFQIINI